ncbi:GNAT family N-acetyltransferase [Halobacillus sp. Nhm2S1]|uniref:GNAT family N-acetyltransferase n=1 Tax=Halobacillus sp. Nhm2S1 TaxID=2866716 RepID=UPI001C73392E|nr:GNAT family protein [Halobacillus sp. Nhm2S1]MBX0359299.1 GNAT family N-acetyltransferase [Halobacillus sp. Nhm2S1]
MLHLIPFQEKDFPILLSWIESPRFLMQWGGPMFNFPLTHQQLMDYTDAQDRRAFQVYDPSLDAIIGHLSIGRIDKDKKQGRIGKVIVSPEYRGKGYGQQMIQLISTYAFQHLGLERLTLGVFDFNKGAIRCYEKAGFTKDRYFKNHRPFEDELWSLYEMSLNKYT